MPLIYKTYKRGKFFIETGTAQTFTKFLHLSAENIKNNAPLSLFNEILYLIGRDNDRAIALWFQACELSNMAYIGRRRFKMFISSYIVIFIMATYTFWKVVTTG